MQSEPPSQALREDHEESRGVGRGSNFVSCVWWEERQVHLNLTHALACATSCCEMTRDMHVAVAGDGCPGCQCCVSRAAVKDQIPGFEGTGTYVYE